MKLSKKLLFLAASLAPAFASGAVQKGMMEVDFSGSYSWLDAGASDLDIGLISGSFGYFFTDALETSAGLTYLRADIEGVDMDAIMLSGAVDYHFNTQSDLVPFVGAALHYADVDVGFGSGDDFGWEVRAGMKQFIAQNVAIRYSVSYLELDDSDLEALSVGLGLSVFF